MRGRIRVMRFRKLRIAWSVVCGIIALLLIVLWVRTYWWVESIQIRPTKTRMLVISSMPGVLQIDLHEGPLVSLATTHQSTSEWRQFVLDIGQPLELRSQLLVRMKHDPYEDCISIPYWFAFLLTCAVAGASWIRWTKKRFSLRTLLIATTLVAVGLGLAVYAASN